MKDCGGSGGGGECFRAADREAQLPVRVPGVTPSLPGLRLRRLCLMTCLFVFIYLSKQTIFVNHDK